MECCAAFRRLRCLSHRVCDSSLRFTWLIPFGCFFCAYWCWSSVCPLYCSHVSLGSRLVGTTLFVMPSSFFLLLLLCTFFGTCIGASLELLEVALIFQPHCPAAAHRSSKGRRQCPNHESCLRCRLLEHRTLILQLGGPDVWVIIPRLV